MGQVWPLGRGLGPPMEMQPYKPTFLFGEMHFAAPAHASSEHLARKAQPSTVHGPWLTPMCRYLCGLCGGTCGEAACWGGVHMALAGLPFSEARKQAISNQNAKLRAHVCFRESAQRRVEAQAHFRPSRQLAACTWPFPSLFLNLNSSSYFFFCKLILKILASI